MISQLTDLVCGHLANEGQLVSRDTFSGFSDDTLTISPPNIDYTYLIRQTEINQVKLWRSHSLTGERSLVMTGQLDRMLATLRHPEGDEYKLLYWLNCAIVDDVKAQFTEAIAAWDWKKLAERARNNPQDDDEGNSIGLEFLGTVMALAPSGKFYTPWARSNVSVEEANVDTIWLGVLESEAERHGGWIQSGEGDPCDLFFAIALCSSRHIVDALNAIPNWTADGSFFSGILLEPQSSLTDPTRPTIIVEAVDCIGDDAPYRCRYWLNDTLGYDTESEIYCHTTNEVVEAVRKLIQIVEGQM